MSSTAYRGAEYRSSQERGFAGRYDGRRESIEWLDHLSRLFDMAFVLPGTNIRYGIEAILRLIPGVGDVAASALPAFLLYSGVSIRLGVPRHLFLRMLANVATEGIVGSVCRSSAMPLTWLSAPIAGTSGCCESISSAPAGSELTGRRFSAPSCPARYRESGVLDGIRTPPATAAVPKMRFLCDGHHTLWVLA